MSTSGISSVRAGIIAATTAGNNFHENVVLAKV